MRKGFSFLVISVLLILLAGCKSFLGAAFGQPGMSELQETARETLRYACVWGKWPTKLTVDSGEKLYPIKCYGDQCVVKYLSSADSTNAWYFTFNRKPLFENLGEQTIPYKAIGYQLSDDVKLQSSFRGNLSITCRPDFTMRSIGDLEAGDEVQYSHH